MATAMPTPTPTPPPTATPTIAPISLSCPSNTGVSTDFQDSFGAPTQTGGPIWQIAGLSLPDVVCSYQDPAHNAISITLADNFPTSDLNAVEQFLSTTNGTYTPETFTPVTGVGGQAVWYSFSYAAMGGGRQAVCGMVATQGIPCVDRFEHSEMCSSWSMDPHRITHIRP
jgi:hypothetical protein